MELVVWLSKMTDAKTITISDVMTKSVISVDAA